MKDVDPLMSVIVARVLPRKTQQSGRPIRIPRKKTDNPTMRPASIYRSSFRDPVRIA